MSLKKLSDSRLAPENTTYKSVIDIVLEFERKLLSISRFTPKETSIYTPFFKASYTLEAAFIFPFFLTLMIFGVFMFRILEVESGVQKAIDTSARTIAATYIGEDSAQLAQAIAYSTYLVEKNNVPTGYIDGNLLGINYLESSTTGNYVDIKATYDLTLPIGLLGRYTYTISQEAKARKWIGFDINEYAWDGVYVYITPNGDVYHTNINCVYLNPSISAVSYSSIGSLRNKSSGKYYACKHCHGDNNKGTVYITDYGTTYHSDINCDTLKRTIKKVLYDDIKDIRPPCSKCGGYENSDGDD